MRLFILSASLACAQSDTLPPADQHVVLTLTGRGTQIYTCQNAQWIFQAPEATLFDSAGKEIGKHGAGPVWTLRDGRSVKGQVMTKSDSPTSGNIPWLLLKGEGSFEYVRRSETRGGLAPAAVCEAGNTVRVPYSAVYTFYSAR